MNFMGRLRQRKALNKKTGKAEVLTVAPYIKKCQYPINEATRGSAFIFCHSTVENEAFPYCEKHCRIAYTNYEQIKDKKRMSYSGNVRGY
jgi:hypothetical protein